jgi:hypothetical protein
MSDLLHETWNSAAEKRMRDELPARRMEESRLKDEVLRLHAELARIKDGIMRARESSLAKLEANRTAVKMDREMDREELS